MYIDRVDTGRSDKESIYEIITKRSLQSGKYELTDYDKPSASMKSKHANQPGYQHDDLEMFDYPGRYSETSDSDRLAKVRLEARQTVDERRWAMRLPLCQVASSV